MKRSQELVNNASIPKGRGINLLQDIGEIYAQHTIHEFYKHTPIQPTKITLTQNETTHEINSLFYDYDIPLSNIQIKDEKYSDFTEQFLRLVSIDLENTWNGQTTNIQIIDDKIEISESDFYTELLVQRLLYLEAANAVRETSWNISKISKGDLPLRSMILSKPEDLPETQHIRGGDSGGVIIAEHNGKYHLILGERSPDVKVNMGLISIAPNGSIQFLDFEENDNPFEAAAEREFDENVNLSEGTEVKMRPSQSEYTIDGFNLREGSISVAYPIIVNADNSKKLEECFSLSDEFEKMVAINIRDMNEMAEYVTFGRMSPENIGKTYKCLNYLSDQLDIPYNIDIFDGE